MLTDRKTSEKNINVLLKIWKKFGVKTMKDYHNLYLKFDVLLLADLFEKTKNNGLKNCGLFPSHYLRFKLGCNA